MKQTKSPSPSACTVLITGASSGIGLAMANELAKQGYRLVLSARSKDLLENMVTDYQQQYGTHAIAILQDLATPNGAEGLIQTLHDQQLHIDILINNAGFGSQGSFQDLKLADEQMMVQLNITSLITLCHGLIPGMLARGFGKIMNVASTAAFQPGPFMANYYATKAYVLSFSQALREELKQTPITLTTLCPGYTATQFAQRAKMEKTRLAKGFISSQSAEDVARYAIYAMQRGKNIAVPGFINRCLRRFSTLTPTLISLKIIRWLNS